MPVDSKLAMRAAETTLDHIHRNILNDVLDVCAKLEVDKLLSAHEITGSLDDGDNARQVAIILQVKQNTAQFDSKVKLYNNGSSEVVVNPSRINVYGRTADCIASPFTREYCYCKSNLSG